MGILDTLTETFKQVVARKKEEFVITSDNVVEACRNVSTIISTNLAILTEMDDNMCNVLAKALAASPDRDANGAYKAYVSGLSSTAKRSEMSRFMGSFTIAFTNLLPIIADIQKNADALIKNKEITASGVRITHAAVVGLLNNAYTIGLYANYLLDRAQSEYLGDAKSIPKYRTVFLTTRTAAVSEYVSLIIDKGGRYSFIADMGKLRQKGVDVLLNTEGGASHAMIPDSSLVGMKGFLDGFSLTSPFFFIAKLWDDMVHYSYLRNKQTKTWLENRAAMIRMKMANIDPASPEYKELQQIAENYDELVTQYDQKIQAYMDRE